MSEHEAHSTPEESVLSQPTETALPPPDRQVTFQLLPGQHIDIQLTTDGRVFVTVTSEEPAPQVEAPSETGGTAEGAAPSERQERVTVHGRVSSTPRFRTTRNGRRIATFGVAEHPDTETTQFHRILAFDQRADQLQTKPLDKGQAVEVVGYPHHREVTTNGVKQSIEEIYATAIRRR